MIGLTYSQLAHFTQCFAIIILTSVVYAPSVGGILLIHLNQSISIVRSYEAWPSSRSSSTTIRTGCMGAIFENEFMYQSWHVSKLLDYLSHPDGRLPLQFFSFFGHYGVVIFVFLSAYGLEKKYGRTTKEVRPLPFIWTHYLKLLSMCIVGYAAYLLLNALYESYPPTTYLWDPEPTFYAQQSQYLLAQLLCPRALLVLRAHAPALCCLSSAPFPSLVGRDRRSDPRM